MQYESYLDYIIKTADFIINDSDVIQSLNGGILKTFTSQASSLAVIFKWDFGDGITLNSSERIVTHDYANPGTYTVKHQACLIDAPCCYTNDLPWCIKEIIVAVVDICNWIISIGGWHAITTYYIMLLVDAYLGHINLGFTVRMQDINGAISYYLGFLDSGNMYTGCSFT